MDMTQHEQSGPPPPPLESLRPRNGLGVAALVIGVASLVAVVSFVLFPLALLAGLVGLVLGIIALTRSSNRGATTAATAHDSVALWSSSPSPDLLRQPGRASLPPVACPQKYWMGWRPRPWARYYYQHARLTCDTEIALVN